MKNTKRTNPLAMAMFYGANPQLAKDQEIARLKAENKLLRKAGDEVALQYAERIEIEAGQTVQTLMQTLPVLKAWQQAKGMQS